MKYVIVLDGTEKQNLGRPIQQRDIQLWREEYNAVYHGTTLIERPHGFGKEAITSYIFERIKK